MPQEGSARPLPVSDERLARMRDGAQALWRWLGDVSREGLASLEERPQIVDDRVAALHDASAGGMARWLQFVGERIGEQPGWPTVVAGELGRLALLTAAWTRFDELDDDVRAAVLVRSGVSVRKSAVEQDGDRVPGLWTVVGERVQEDDRGLVSRRTALIGPRPALVVEHAFGQAPPAVAPVGHELFADVVFWPGRGAVRARVLDAAVTQGWEGEGADTLQQTLHTVSQAFGVNPLLQRLPVAIRGVRAVRDGDRTWLVDADGAALPVHGDGWDLLTRSGGDEVVVGGVWTGRTVDVMSLVHDGAFHPVYAEDTEPPAPRTDLDARTQRLLVGTHLDDLLDAGRHSILCRAAPVPRRVAVPERQPDARPAMPASVASALEATLRRHPDWLDIVVQTVEGRGERMSAPLLQRLLSVPEAHWCSVEPLLGPSERHLAAMEDRWRWAADLPLSVGWQRAELRTACLHAALATRPDAARDALQSRWADCVRASERVALLGTLGPWLRDADATWLEQVLDDDAVTVRRAAGELLSRCPGSGYVERMTARARAWWPEPGRVRLPDALTAEDVRDGLGPHVNDVPARRRVWCTAVGHARGSDWDRVTARLGAEEWMDRALVDSVARTGTAAQARLLVDDRPTAALLRRLSATERESVVCTALLRGDAELAVGLEAPWSDAVVHTWRAGIEQHVARCLAAGQGPDAAWVDSLAAASRSAPLTLAPIVRAPMPGPRASDPEWRALIAASRAAADRIVLRVRFQASDLGPNGALPEPVG